MIGVIDYGAGNLRSLTNALKFLEKKFRILNVPETKGISVLILPGVGAFGSAMEKLKKRGWVDLIKEWVENKPLLGICLGMQLFFDESEEEGTHAGLGILKGNVRKLPVKGLSLPHMGWNEVSLKRESPLLEGFPFPKYFYFAHSYCVLPEENEVIIGETEYGVIFPSIVGRENLLGFQFHPEKSGNWGLKLIEIALKRLEERC